MIRKILTLAFCVLCILSAERVSAQSMGHSYRTALGVKFYPGGITFKHFLRTNRAIEGIAYFWDHGFRFTGLYEVHGDINGAAGLKWYVGPGAHIGFYNEGWYRRKGNKYYYYDDGDFAFGIDGVLGLDYKIKGAPLNLSVDIQPSFEILRHPYLTTWGGFAIRYTF
ncbi:MAG TPA: hypothetical protein VJT83_02160 [Chitinophagaceae bacterium]|nr:hypothetical protein [Chitinophagaceae bacterium]